MGDKEEKMDTCNCINDLYSEHMKLISNNCTKIKNDDNLMYICSYSLVLFDYGKDIAFLTIHDRNTSIEPLSRDLLDCYAITKKLISNYKNKTKFSEYIKQLYSKDMYQNSSIYKALKTDLTFSNCIKKEKDLEDILKNFEKNINKFFPDEIKNIDRNNLDTSLLNLVDKILNKFPKESNTKIVGNAIKENQAIKKENEGKSYKGSLVIYRELCHSTHNNISSISERLINASRKIEPNNESRHANAALSIDFFSLKDIHEEFKKILLCN